MNIYLNYLKINCQNVKCAKYFPYTFILMELAHQRHSIQCYSIYRSDFTDASCMCFIILSTEPKFLIMYLPPIENIVSNISSS